MVIANRSPDPRTPVARGSLHNGRAASPAGHTLAALAAPQSGVVSLGQMLAGGVTRHEIARRISGGDLHRIHRGVYAVGHPGIGWEGRCFAGLLAAGPDAVLSFWSAAAWWRLIRQCDGPVHVTVERAIVSRPGLVVHQSRGLPVAHRTRRWHVPVTTVPRTLLDMADVADDRTLRRAVREAQVQSLTDERRIVAAITAVRGRRGAPRLWALVADGPAPTRSDLEDATLDLIIQAGLPRPQTNTDLPGFGRPMEVDLFFPEAALVVEADSRQFHDNRLARQDDAAKQALLETAGFRVLRVTWDEVTRRPAQTTRRIAAAHAAQMRAA